jgi:hypothetical protein
MHYRTAKITSLFLPQNFLILEHKIRPINFRPDLVSILHNYTPQERLTVGMYMKKLRGRQYYLIVSVNPCMPRICPKLAPFV